MRNHVLINNRPGRSLPGQGPGDPGGGGGTGPLAEPTYNAATDTLLLTETFDSYIDATDMYNNRFRSGAHLAQGDGNLDAAHISLITGRTGAGKSCRMAYDGINQEGHTLTSYNLPATVSKTLFLTEWRRVIMGTPLNTGGDGSQMATKWMMFFQQDPSGGSTRWQFNTHDYSPWAGTLPPVGCLWQSIQGGYTNDDNGLQPVGPYATDLFNGGLWHRYTYAFRPHTSLSQKDGFGRMWIDGTLVMRVEQAAVGPTLAPGGYKEWCSQTDVDKLSLNLNGNGILTTIDFLMWMDVLTVPVNMPGGFTVDIDDVQVFNRP